MTRAYVEHVAVRVRDIHWHIRFFREVFGMTAREYDGPPADPRQYWAVGGIQLLAAPDFTGGEGPLAHIGVMCDDVDAALAAAEAFGVEALPKGRNWLRLRDGVELELLQASGGSVGLILAIDPRHSTEALGR